MQYVITILALGLAGFIGWLYHKRTKDVLDRYERLVEDMFDRKMAQGDYQSYTYGKSVKAQQRVVQFLDELKNKNNPPADVMQMGSNRG